MSWSKDLASSVFPILVLTCESHIRMGRAESGAGSENAPLRNIPTGFTVVLRGLTPRSMGQAMPSPILFSGDIDHWGSPLLLVGENWVASLSNWQCLLHFHLAWGAPKPVW